jgi:superfamily II DNA or RNA helicase
MYNKTLSIQLADWIKIPVQGLPPQLERKIHERLVFTNPDYEFRHNRGEWLGNIPAQINCMRKTARHYLLPRGFLEQLLELCKKLNQPYRIVDQRRVIEDLPIEFHGQLKEYQQEAAEAVLERDFATLVGGSKSGKTVVALYVIAQRKQPTLVLIPTIALLDGWLKKIENFLQIPASEVGVIVEGNHRQGKSITVAHTGEIIRHWRQVRDSVGFVILDECQRCPSRVFTQLMPNFDARYILGLANTTQRRDRLARFIYYYVGDVAHTIDEKEAREGRGIIQAQVVARPTGFDYPYVSRADYASMLNALMHDEERTRLIADDIEAELKQQPQPILVLSGSNEQHAILAAELRRRNIMVTALDQEVEAAEDDDNGAGATESLDVPLSTDPMAILVTPETLIHSFRNRAFKVLFLATPVYFKGRLAHAIRNLQPNDNGTRLKIYDYVDRNVGLLGNYFRMRSYNYGVHPDLLMNSN